MYYSNNYNIKDHYNLEGHYSIHKPTDKDDFNFTNSSIIKIIDPTLIMNK